MIKRIKGDERKRENYDKRNKEGWEWVMRYIKNWV